MTGLPVTKPEWNFAELEFCGAHLFVDPGGCIYWEQENLLVVSDLHLEKGSSFAARNGLMMPPYDTAKTLELLAQCIAFWQPKTVISLGDSFHDEHASQRIPSEYKRQLQEVIKNKDWLWICGNHDPSPPEGLEGCSCSSVHIGPLNFTHEPTINCETGEIAGHLHPCAKIRRRGKSVRRRCAASDGKRLILPAFGAFTGGLNIRDDAFTGLFEEADLSAWLLSGTEVYEISGKYLVR